jgi:membrane associated rhomboid family serine protease
VIPLRDYLPTRRPAFINTALILANVFFYLYYFGFTLAPTPDQFAAILPYVAIPAQVSHGAHLETLVTSMFLHASLLHLGGNMLFLYIFGNNVEEDLGHLRYLLFYLLCGIAGGLLQAFVDSNSTVASLGASGAIAGVLAAYAVLFPRARVGTVVLLGFIPLFFRLPALVVIGFWALIQFFGGLAQLASPAQLAQGGVGYFAHIGGFVAGLLLLGALQPRGSQHNEWL